MSHNYGDCMDGLDGMLCRDCLDLEKSTRPPDSQSELESLRERNRKLVWILSRFSMCACQRAFRRGPCGDCRARADLLESERAKSA